MPLACLFRQAYDSQYGFAKGLVANRRRPVSVTPWALQILAARISTVADSCNRGKIYLQLSYLNHWNLDTSENPVIK